MWEYGGPKEILKWEYDPQRKKIKSGGEVVFAFLKHGRLRKLKAGEGQYKEKLKVGV